MSSAEVQEKLTTRENPTYEQAKGLLNYDASCGTYLGKLHKQRSAIVTDRKLLNGTTQFQMTRPDD